MSFKKSFYTHLGTSLWVVAALLTIAPSWPHLYYRLSPKASQALASTLASTVSVTPKPTPTPELSTPPKPTPTPELPEVDPKLPEENGLLIDSIGVRGEIHEGDNWEELLKEGIWRVPNFGNPEESNQPIILAAHRWGYLDWSSSFRKLNSFYNLPKLKKGDSIKIIWNQREYEYKVYATETGTSITEYKANLILYTCQLWNSPVRFFVYANRTN